MGPEAILARLPAESVIYRSPALYGAAMRLLYGRHYADRDRAVAAHVPLQASVLELCCGPARLYRTELRGRVSSYVALDANEGFVARLRAGGVDARRADVAVATLPRADVVLMQAGLYHFLPDAHAMVARMRAAARERVIVSEPVRNLASSTLAPLAWAAAHGARTGGAGRPQRFDERSLDALMARFGDAVRASELIPGGREKVYVLDGAAG